ncbi:MatE efflux family protein [Chloropicon roscoffensis]|uniref:Protein DETOXIFICATION n=1 Tax=Chloropicon roscoffensis TaxID=1461544 RepID=A0AAX4PKX0_9CHLO
MHYQTWANASALGSRGDRGESTSASRSGGPDEVEAVGVASTWRAGSPYDGEIFTLALPALFSVLIDPLMSIVDTAIIGRIGVNELAGTGLAGLLWASFTVALFSFLATAVTPLVSGANVRKDADSVSRTICVGLWLALSIGTALFALKFAGARWFLENVFTSSPEVVGNAMRYLDCRIFSVHATLAQLVCIGALRGLKDTRTILWATVAANALNCVLDCLFIFGFGWGVAGAATSSAISTTLSCGLLLSALVRRGVLRPGDLVPPPSLEEGAPVLGAGIALSSKSVVTMYTVGLASQAIASLGAVSLAAHEIIKQLFFFCYIAVEPLSVAGQSLVAESLGRRQVSRARGIAIRLVQLAVGLGATMGLLIYFLGPRIVHVFTKDAEAVRIALTVLGVVCFFQPLDALMLAQEGVLLGAREHAYISRSVIATSLTCFCALYLVTRTLGLPYTLLHVWLCVKILTMGRILFSSARLYASRHSPILVAAEAEAKEEINL